MIKILSKKILVICIGCEILSFASQPSLKILSSLPSQKPKPPSTSLPVYEFARQHNLLLELEKEYIAEKNGTANVLSIFRLQKKINFHVVKLQEIAREIPTSSINDPYVNIAQKLTGEFQDKCSFMTGETNAEKIKQLENALRQIGENDVVEDALELLEINTKLARIISESTFLPYIKSDLMVDTNINTVAKMLLISQIPHKTKKFMFEEAQHYLNYYRENKHHDIVRAQKLHDLLMRLRKTFTE